MVCKISRGMILFWMDRNYYKDFVFTVSFHRVESNWMFLNALDDQDKIHSLLKYIYLYKPVCQINDLYIFFKVWTAQMKTIPDTGQMAELFWNKSMKDNKCYKSTVVCRRFGGSFVCSATHLQRY